jgi:hypothetical protein
MEMSKKDFASSSVDQPVSMRKRKEDLIYMPGLCNARSTCHSVQELVASLDLLHIAPRIV